jgi:hypothetical protein
MRRRRRLSLSPPRPGRPRRRPPGPTRAGRPSDETPHRRAEAPPRISPGSPVDAKVVGPPSPRCEWHGSPARPGDPSMRNRGVGCKYSAELVTWRFISLLDRPASSTRTSSGNVHRHLNAFTSWRAVIGRPRRMPRSRAWPSLCTPHPALLAVHRPATAMGGAPALLMGLGGLLLVGFGSSMSGMVNWVWPPVMLAVAIWMIVCVRRQLRSRSGCMAGTPTCSPIRAEGRNSAPAPNIYDARVHLRAGRASAVHRGLSGHRARRGPSWTPLRRRRRSGWAR